MLEDFTHGTLEINRGRWFINNIITLSSESSNATSGAHCIYTPLLHSMCVFALSLFFAEMFFNRKVKATRSTVLTIF
jgi:hypothetical protein